MNLLLMFFSRSNRAKWYFLKMETPSTTSQFRLTLIKVSNALTVKNVEDLAFLCERITTAEREKITDAKKLFSALQMLDLLSERKVNVLIDWLDELNLLKASELLKDYRMKCLKGS